MAWETDEATITCLGCGQALRGGKFCSAACYQRELRRRRRARLLKFCARCSVAFVPVRADARFCWAPVAKGATAGRKASAETAPGGPQPPRGWLLPEGRLVRRGRPFLRLLWPPRASMSER